MTQPLRSRVRGARALILLCGAIAIGPGAGISGVARGADVFQLSSDESNALFDKAKASVVQVRSGNPGTIRNGGSGFFIDTQGTVLTSSDILDDSTSACVVVNGVEMDAKILCNDSFSGLAMLRVGYGASPALPLAHAAGLQSGDGVIAIGYPLNLPAAPSQGPVSGFDANYLAPLDTQLEPKRALAQLIRFATTHIHANVAISPGEIGGPLLNSHGEVVGLIAATPDYGRSIYALPVEALNKVLADFGRFGHVRYGRVGINVIEDRRDSAHDGRTVHVVGVMPGTPAAESGIRTGDTVMRIDAREIHRLADVQDASFFSQVGGNVNVVVRRDDRLFNYSFAVIESGATPVKSHIADSPAGK